MNRLWYFVSCTAMVIGFFVARAGIADELNLQSVKPRKIDLRTEFDKRKLSVRHQGQRGACQVFAFVGVIEYGLSKTGKPVDLSEQFLMWAANDANDLDRVDGFNPDYLITGLKKNGICLETQMPYVPRNEPIEKPSDSAIQDASARSDCEVVSIKHWRDDIGFTDDNFLAIMEQIKKKQPVTATVCWPFKVPDKDMVDSRYFLIDRDVDNSKNGHGVILVGYVIDKKVEGGGYFIVRNSWGDAFADQGYVGMSFDYAKKYGIDAYFATVTAPSSGAKSKGKKTKSVETKLDG
jgi:C1A family cysteine protease